MNFKHWQDAARAHAADFGRVSYLSICILVAVTLILEMFAPGIAGNVVSPQRLVFAAVAAGALSLLSPQHSPGEAWKVAVYWLVGLTLTVIVFLSAMSYFESIAIGASVAFCAVLPFLAYAGKENE